jgi:hypothetical protein
LIDQDPLIHGNELNSIQNENARNEREKYALSAHLASFNG